ncbi:hypothetical protein KS4_23380 [Poriferisphaera corsica]|uniref:Helix-turn-helix domain-containing protein n=1 Tax=Poriferisphaera corsica TaxID=2528020 RepID=A0A517YVL4_9BACT|nr:helix-turn-helix domain-containing protein [Poriferisphaera corsica]QDU34271.1 hypothetical protein KS4_23380 [Poriferisphaera corsica]
MINTQDFCCAKEVASKVGKSVRTIQRMCGKNAIKAIQLIPGGEYSIPTSEVERLLKTRLSASSATPATPPPNNAA